MVTPSGLAGSSNLEISGPLARRLEIEFKDPIEDEGLYVINVIIKNPLDDSAGLGALEKIEYESVGLGDTAESRIDVSLEEVRLADTLGTPLGSAPGRIVVDKIELIEIGTSSNPGYMNANLKIGYQGDTHIADSSGPDAFNEDLGTILINGDMVNSSIVNLRGGIESVTVTGDMKRDSSYSYDRVYANIIVARDPIQRVEVIGDLVDSFVGYEPFIVLDDADGNNTGEYPNFINPADSEIGEIDRLIVRGDFTIDLLDDNDNRQLAVYKSLKEMIVGGDYDARINLRGNSNPTDRWYVGDSLVAGAFFQIEPMFDWQGLAAVNTNNNGGLWSGEFFVDLVSYPEEYPDLSADIGGGAFGRVPFVIHGEDSTPPDRSTFLLNPLITNPPVFDQMDVRWYGEIAADGVDQSGGPYATPLAAETDDMPVIVEHWRFAGTSCDTAVGADSCSCTDDDWEDVSHEWSWEVLGDDRIVRLVRDPALPVIDHLTPEVGEEVLGSPTPIGGVTPVVREVRRVYRVRPRVRTSDNRMLLRSVVDGGTQPVDDPNPGSGYWDCPLDESYIVILLEDTFGLRALDLSGDGNVGTEDVLEWMLVPTDLDQSGSADTTDLLHIMNNVE
jgi:hypothetical protein